MELIYVLLGYLIILSPFVAFASWVATRFAMDGIARDCEIRHSWLTWIPVADYWILGGISDHCRMVALGQKKSARVVLLILRSVQVLLWAAFFWCVIGGILDAVTVLGKGAPDRAAELMIRYGILDGLWWLFPALVLGVVVFVRKVMALYDLYATFTPEKRIGYLLLSVCPVVNLIALPLCLHRCREDRPPQPETL